MLDAPSQFESCFCLPKHISEDIQVSFTQLHWFLCPLKTSPWCVLCMACKRNQMWVSENRLFSFVFLEYNFGLTDMYLSPLSFDKNFGCWNKKIPDIYYKIKENSIYHTSLDMYAFAILY